MSTCFVQFYDAVVGPPDPDRETVRVLPRKGRPGQYLIVASGGDDESAVVWVGLSRDELEHLAAHIRDVLRLEAIDRIEERKESAHA